MLQGWIHFEPFHYIELKRVLKHLQGKGIHVSDGDISYLADINLHSDGGVVIIFGTDSYYSFLYGTYMTLESFLSEDYTKFNTLKRWYVKDFMRHTTLMETE